MLFFYLDEYAKDQPKDLLSVLAVTGDWLTHALKKHSTLVEKNIDALSGLLQLNKAERALLLYGTPGWLIRPLFVRWPALLFVGRVLTKPLVAFGLFNTVFLGYHVPSLYDAILASEALHAAAHLAFIVTALITWWPVLGPLPDLLPRLPYPGQMLYLFVQTQPAQILGAMLTFADSALYRPYVAAPRVWESVTPLVDQQLGGLVMWVGGGTFFLGVFVAVFLRWAQLNERAESQGAPSRV